MLTNPNMTVAEALALKSQLEQTVRAAIQKFVAATGLEAYVYSDIVDIEVTVNVSVRLP